MLQSVFEAFHLPSNYFPCREGAPYANAHKADDFLVLASGIGDQNSKAQWIAQCVSRRMDVGAQPPRERPSALSRRPQVHVGPVYLNGALRPTGSHGPLWRTRKDQARVRPDPS